MIQVVCDRCKVPIPEDQKVVRALIQVNPAKGENDGSAPLRSKRFDTETSFLFNYEVCEPCFRAFLGALQP